jgi:hypothetical protein
MIMRKVIALLVFGFVVASAPLARANVYINWVATAGFFWSADSSSLLTSGSGQSALVQLIWSQNNVADTATFGAANFVSGDDFFLASLTLKEGVNSSVWCDFLPPTVSVFDDGGTRPAGGYVYARIFQDAAPGVGDWYYAGALLATANLDPTKVPPDTPQSYNLNRDGVNGDAINGTYGAQVVPVPEPGTMALFALGVATLAAARRRRKGVTA